MMKVLFLAPAMTTSARPTTYDTDFYAWTQEQAELLRQGRLADIDLENLIEEIESLGRSERRSFRSALLLLTQHLLKWQYQPEKRSPSWQTTIRTQRRQIAMMLEDNPSFKAWIPEALAKGYADGRKDAADETGISLPTFPETCPYPWEQLTDEDWLPD
jgi:hypothetical protein